MVPRRRHDSNNRTTGRFLPYTESRTRTGTPDVCMICWRSRQPLGFDVCSGDRCKIGKNYT